LVRQVHQGKARAQIETAFHLRFSPDEVKSIELDDSPWEGAADAPVTIVEWADFECPFCGAASPQLNKLVKRFAPHVKLVFKNYPLGMHEFAEGAARASVAAQKQGKFWELHEWMFSNQQSLDKKNLLRRAKELGLDEQQFIADSESEATADIVNRDRKQADKLGLRGTPTIYINGRSFDITTFSLFEDMDDWVKTEILLRTGKEVEPASDPDADKDTKPTEDKGAKPEAPASGAQAGGPSSG
jgi:protein-disulfide isomerase